MTARITSEEDLIQTYLAPLASKVPGALGLKDDCALIVPPPGSSLVVSTDAIAAGVHFFPDDDASDIGWKALAVNVSDLVAKGATPLGYQMALSFPEAPTQDWMTKFAAGLAEAQAAFGISLTGGDTDKRPGPVTITITAFGTVPQGQGVFRSGAQPGDRIYVSGRLGDSALGLRLRQDRDLAKRLELTAGAVSHAVQRYLRPKPALALAPVVRAHATAAMDLSDGLLKDLDRLCRASGVSASIFSGALPVSQGVRTAVASNDASLSNLALTGGDDYQVLCAIPEQRAPAFEADAQAARIEVTFIGTIGSDAGVSIVDDYEGRHAAVSPGWDHF